VVVGIDLRSGPRYPTGLAVMGLDRRLRRLEVVRTDEQIDAAIEYWRPVAIAIDAPLALPDGRCCADIACECARFGIFREIDRLIAALGYRPYPTLLPSMVGLTIRGSTLCARLLARGELVLEVYPGMVQDILGIPRKQAGLDALTRGLRRTGVRGIPRTRRVSHDELDAATCALAAVLHIEGRTEMLGPGVPVPFVFPAREALPRASS
jgi:predicted nuclease with RNAse H fold